MYEVVLGNMRDPQRYAMTIVASNYADAWRRVEGIKTPGDYTVSFKEVH